MPEEYLSDFNDSQLKAVFVDVLGLNLKDLSVMTEEHNITLVTWKGKHTVGFLDHDGWMMQVMPWEYLDNPENELHKLIISKWDEVNKAMIESEVHWQGIGPNPYTEE